MAIEIVDLPINSILIFHSFLFTFTISGIHPSISHHRVNTVKNDEPSRVGAVVHVLGELRSPGRALATGADLATSPLSFPRISQAAGFDEFRLDIFGV
jgi:hypothetical protein